MRRLIVSTLLSLFLISGTGFAFADNHRGGGHDKGHKEQKFDKKRHDGKKDHGNKGFGNKHNKNVPDRKPGKPGNIGHKSPMPPAPPAPPAFRPKHYNHAYHYPHYSVHDNLGYMISQIARGGRDINVWQVDPGTYVVRFRKGNHLFAQYLYPYEGRYGKRNTISVNWSPLSPWTLIPSIHLNINL